MIGFLESLFRQQGSSEALVWKDTPYSYQWLLDRIGFWRGYLKDRDIKPLSVVVLEADFSPNAIALLLALIEWRCIIVPLTLSSEVKKQEFIAIAKGQIKFTIDAQDEVVFAKLAYDGSHALYDQLRQLNHPGLVLFSSGSTGQSKGVVHDLTRLLEKYKSTRKAFRMISFLLYDHIGGFNTLLYSLSSGGCLIIVKNRTPKGVLEAIEKFKVEILPTSPTFINLILLSEMYKDYDLSSLKTISYGTEPMAETTLQRLHHILPGVRLYQTYGLSEVGILKSRSKSSDSLWVKVGGEGYETRVVEGILHIKAQASMLGYLNAPSPFLADGWFNTQDEVIQDGEYIQILGRSTDIINVGGEKVYPAEVENVIQRMPEIAEVSVYGEKNPIVGNIVCARIQLKNIQDQEGVVSRLKKYCAQYLQNYKIPVKVIVDQDIQHNDRFKKMKIRST